MMRVLVFLLLACLCATGALAEIPCVSPADAVVVIQSPQAGAQPPAPGLSLLPLFPGDTSHFQITCPTGKRVGLWLIGPDPVLLLPIKVAGCEVGVVVETRWQTVEGLQIRGAKVGVCWRGDDGILAAVDIEASDHSLVSSGKAMYARGGRQRSRMSWPTAPDGVAIKVQDEIACTCQGAV